MKKPTVLILLLSAIFLFAVPAAAADLFAPPAGMVLHQTQPIAGLEVHVDVTVISGWVQYDYSGKATIQQGFGPPQQVSTYSGYARHFLPWAKPFEDVLVDYPPIDFSALVPTH